MNRVLLTGRLTRDPELRTLASGKTVTQFSIATNEYRGGAEKSEFHNVVTWDSRPLGRTRRAWAKNRDYCSRSAHTLHPEAGRHPAARRLRSPQRRPAMTKVVLTHAVEDVERWLGFKSERAASIGAMGGSNVVDHVAACLLYTSPSPRDRTRSRMPSSA